MSTDAHRVVEDASRNDGPAVLVGACSVPSPPLLLPGATGGLVAEVERLRVACLDAVRAVLSAEPDLILIIAGTPDSGPANPLGLRVGRALLSEAGCCVPVEDVVVAASASAAECTQLGQQLAARSGRLGLVVMADGSACRTVKAPGYLDDRAVPFDAVLFEALVAARWDEVAAVDTGIAAELLVAGRAPWQVLAAACGRTSLTATALYADDPFGVWYPVLVFSPADGIIG